MTLAVAAATCPPVAVRAQAVDTASVDALVGGFDYVRLPNGGFNEWKSRGGLDLCARASRTS